MWFRNLALRNLQRLSFGLLMAVGLNACHSPVPLERPIEYYTARERQHAPEPVYSRVMWSQIPAATPQKSKEDAPYLLPTISFEMPNATLEEAVEALAQTMGYQWHYPRAAAKRAVSINQVGTVDQILAEIANQAGVVAEFDHAGRQVRVFDVGMKPRLSLPEGARARTR